MINSDDQDYNFHTNNYSCITRVCIKQVFKLEVIRILANSKWNPIFSVVSTADIRIKHVYLNSEIVLKSKVECEINSQRIIRI